MTLIKKSINLLFSSDPELGNIRVLDSGGSSFIATLDTTIDIDPAAQDITVSQQSGTVWFNFANIKEGVNNLFYISGQNNNNELQSIILEIPTGLYNISTLNQAIRRELVNNDFDEADPVIQLIGDDATQKVIIKLLPGSSVDFTQPNTPREILGFDSVLLQTQGTEEFFLANNIARFNQIGSLLINSDIVDTGLIVNGKFNSTLSQILIDVGVGEQIQYNPRNPVTLSANNLLGTKRKNIKFFLTDELLRPLDTRGEYWTVRILIEYYIPFIIEKSFR